MAIFITFWDLLYIKTWLCWGQPYPAYIGDWGSHFINASLFKLFAFLVLFRVNNKQDSKLKDKVATH